jgi:membrane protein implicated in regulation of membrane protease activity
MLAYVFTGIWAALLVGSVLYAILGDAKFGIPASVASTAALAVSLVLTDNIYLGLFAQVAVAAVVVSVPLIWYAIAGKSNRDKFVKKGAANIRGLIGKRCLVVEEISNIHNKGLVKLGGNVWSAATVNENDFVEEGTIVVVRYVEGVKLVCSREK